MDGGSRDRCVKMTAAKVLMREALHGGAGRARAAWYVHLFFNELEFATRLKFKSCAE